MKRLGPEVRRKREREREKGRSDLEEARRMTSKHTNGVGGKGEERSKEREMQRERVGEWENERMKN
jgi:hypothetical protein